MSSVLFNCTHALLIARLGRDQVRVEVGPPATLTIAAAHPAVGDIVVQDDESELMIALGEHHHWHCALYQHDRLPDSERVGATAEDAHDSIGAILSGKTVLRLTRRDGRIRSTTTYRSDLTEMEPLGPEDEEFTWFGPLRAGTP